VKESVKRALKEGLEFDNGHFEILQKLKGEINSPEWQKSAKKIMFDLGREVAKIPTIPNWHPKPDIIDKATDIRFEIIKISKSQNYQDFGKFGKELDRAFELGMENNPIHDGLYE
jgi:hypothetical protein